ncbi:helix-turn-helix transcriptional regulator [Pseudomonas sp. MWU12-2037]|uniref:helix-turn-helix domain-containing protein n=1 Tax=Pseudomonas sp. MWU12-2037 TaxID=2928690 RepID=UPI00200BD3DB|nr:helix-turn-helix transcriptional regulator [Pseudomonas sp. MWU12-2037]
MDLSTLMHHRQMDVAVGSGARLRALLKECHLTATDFALYCGVKAQHVNNWFNRGVPLRRQEAIAALLSVNVRWLREGRGLKYPERDDKKQQVDRVVCDKVSWGTEVKSTSVRWVRMLGDNMGGRIPGGALVAFEPSLAKIEEKTVCVFMLDGVQRVDYLYPEPNGSLGLFRYSDANTSKDNNSQVNDVKPIVEVCGRVLGWVMLDALA